MARLLVAALVVIAAQAPPPSTDIYLLELKSDLSSVRQATPVPIAVEKGYDNQPFFTPDGRAILFTANRDGKQTDIYERALGGATRRLTMTSESEYSPTLTPDGGISVIRVEADGTQRLWRFDRDGGNPRLLLENVKPVGYHAWIDSGRLALFVLGPPATLRLAAPGPGAAETVATDIGRSIHRIPNQRAVSFVQRDAEGAFLVKRLNVDDKQITTLAPAVAGSADRDTAWMPDGTLLMSAGTKVYARAVLGAAAAEWREIYDVSPHRLGIVSRIAVAPDGKAIAIVVAGE
jgi:dipeptidyl aminopeptidase/acylaminoacyl peptidase